MGYNTRDEDLFHHFTKGLDQKLQAELNLMFTRNRMLDKEEHRREMEKMKQEIIEEVMSRISIWIETEAIAKLSDMLNNLGKGGAR